MSDRAIPQCFFDFIRQEEGCVDQVYADSAGKLTAGYGHVVTGLSLGSPVSAAAIQDWLQSDAAIAADRLESRVGSAVIEDLTDHQYAALLSFVFNLGANPKWTIWKRLSARQFDQVPLEMMKFVNAEVGGQMVKVKGLVNRRAAEVALLATDEPGTADVKMSSSVTRTADTPPTPADPVSAGKSKGLILGAIGAVAAVPQAIDSATHVLAPYASHSALIEKMVATLFTVAGGCAAASWAYTYWQKRAARN